MNSILDIFLFAVNSVLPIVLVVLLGYYLKRIGLFTKEFLRVGNKTVFHLLLPVLLFTNLADMSDFSEINAAVVGFVLCAVVLLIICGWLLSFMVRDPLQKGVIWQCTFRSNFALIGVSLAQLMCGAAGVRCAAILSAFTIPLFNIMAVISLSVPKRRGEADAESGIRAGKIVHDIVRNPLIIAVMLGVAWVLVRPLLEAALPAPVISLCKSMTFVPVAMEYLSKASTPIALLVLGGQFEFCAIGRLKKQIAIGCVGRLLLAPLIGIGGAVLLQKMGVFCFDNSVYAALVALFGSPVAVASAIMADEMGNDGQLAGQLVVWTTLLSAFSIFGIVILLKALGLL